MNENEIKFASNYITKIALEQNGAEKVNLAIQSLLTTYMKEANLNVQENEESLPTVSTALVFTQKEIKNMAKSFKKVFIANGLCAHVLKKPSGKNTFCYEIRYRANGYDIRVSSTDLQKAKDKFLEKTSPNQIDKYFIDKSNQPHTKSSFEQFALFFFETHRKNKVTPQTYKGDIGRLKKHILPSLGKISLKQITPDKCLTLIQRLQNEGKGKTADEVYSLLSIIFKGAIAYGILQKSPLAIIQIQKHVRESGTALTKEEEKFLLMGLTEPEFQTAIAIALYTGLRPNELASAKISGDFIVALNSKRKNGKVEYKRIPVINALRPYIADGIPPLPTPQLIRRRISAVLPNHKLYDLRTTFYTRCDEYGVAAPARDEFVGHSSGVLTNTYRDLSNEYLLKEGAKLNEWK